MPQALGGLILPLVQAVPFFSPAVANAVALGIGYAATSAALYGIQAVLTPSGRGGTPKPEDGKLNFKQSIPSIPFVLGRVRKGGDYVFFEERDGTAYHIMVIAAHRIQGFTQHWLHDEKVTLDEDGYVTAPDHFLKDGPEKIRILTRLGHNVTGPYTDVVNTFGGAWTENHRGDGLASVRMSCETAEQKDYLKVYPNQMPEHTVELDGENRIYDPRTGTRGFSTNIALFRLWHLTHPVGGKLSLDDMYLPDWSDAADVCDETVRNRFGGAEQRYHGGMWFRAENDPVEIGRLLDQAGELVVYERPDGLVGVHAGKMATPDITLTEDSITAVEFQANRSISSSVIAVRGEYTDATDGRYVSRAAVPYGDPYAEASTERTRTVENQVVQSHNHISRMQKLTYIRANAPRVTVVAHYHAAKHIPSRRFVRVHYPPRLVQAIVEITSRPRLSLSSMTIEFSGIVVPSALYDFDASIEEGSPGTPGEVVVPTGVPLPVNFDVTIDNEVVSGGGTAAYALATWDQVSDSLIYELEWQRASGGTLRTVFSEAGQNEVRSEYLADGVEYRFRLRTWSGGQSSEWTDYVNRTASADPTAPDPVTDVTGTGGSGEFTFEWTAPNSANYFASRLWLNTVDNSGTATLVATEYGSPNDNETVLVSGLTAGTYYGWVEAINASGVGAALVATGSKVVS